MRAKFYLVCFILAFVQPCEAAVVSRARAQAVAERFFGQASARTKSAGQGEVRLVASYPKVETKAGDEAPTVYAFSRDKGGFVLIAGEDAAYPVLGYSLEGSFPSEGQMPPALKEQLAWYDALLQRARTEGWEASPAVRSQWADPVKAVPTSSPVKLETALWNQWEPYNNLCPTINGTKCPCGCVATGMAIIMRYHSWPAHGTGSLRDYDYGWDGSSYTYHQQGIELGHAYNWQSMSPDGNFSAFGSDQVARLIMDLGIMSQMEYAPNGSGASGAAPLELPVYFGYDKQMRYLSRSDFSETRWEMMIRAEIDANRPVFYSGFDKSSGHAFVLDGYNGRYFSINYGWGGSSNAYYLLSPVDGNKWSLTEFNNDQSMVTHIMPDQGGEQYLYLYLWGGPMTFGWNFRADSFRSNKLYIGDDSPTGSAELAYCLFDKDGYFKELLSDVFQYIHISSTSIVPRMDIQAPSQIENGDFVTLSRRDDDFAWIPVLGDRSKRIVFDRSRKLADMVSLGHSFGSTIRPDYSARPLLFFRAYKDLYWELRRTSDGAVLVNSASEAKWSDGLLYSYVSYDLDVVDFSFHLPSGQSYQLFFRHFDEEMTIHIDM